MPFHWRARRLSIPAALLISAIAGSAQAITTTGVGYLTPGTAFAETVALDGVIVSLSATGAQRATLPDSTPDIRFFRTPTSSVTWSFSEAVNEFSLDIRSLEPGEFFRTDLGAPASLSGGLTLSGDKIVGGGSGTALFRNIDVTSVIVDYGSSRGDASVVGFGLSAVPLPAALPAFLASLAFIGWRARRQKAA